MVLLLHCAKIKALIKLQIIRSHSTIVSKVTAHFKKHNDILIAGRTKSDIQVDIPDSHSMQAMFEKSGLVDAIVCIAGEPNGHHLTNLAKPIII